MDEMDTFVVNTSSSPYAKLRPVPLEAVCLKDNFWAPRLQLVYRHTLPTQYKLCVETGRIARFQGVAVKDNSNFKGYIFNDSDVYKWVEAVAFSLVGDPDQNLRNLVDEVIRVIASAQDKDGYLNTRFPSDKKEERWTNLRDMHELYCAGHLAQAAIAFYRATGERQLLDVACRFADHIIGVFGPGKRQGTCGHPEIEMALVELYRTTGKQNYIQMAKAFLDNRGRGIIGGSINLIDHKPFRQLTEIVGHAVRSLYLNCGAADLYMETGEKDIWNALENLWHNLTERKMYVTGGAGARYEGEKFGSDYELPNVMAYTETCAAIANVMWNWRMFLITGESRFIDVLELALYNGALSGISLDGENYFYINPLADRGGHRRQRWFECACCPPNIARMLASLPGYFYSLSAEGLWINLYAENTAHLKLDGKHVTIMQHTSYPWDGKVEITLLPEREGDFPLYLRIPGWCRKASVDIDGVDMDAQPRRYFEVHRTWKIGDRVSLSLHMPVERLACNPNVAENFGRVAITRGPLIYCVEQVDNDGFDVWDLVLPVDSEIRAEWVPSLLNGVIVVRGKAVTSDSAWSQSLLYHPLNYTPHVRHVEFVAIPYYAWANRKPCPMTVWIRSQNQ